MQLHWTPAFLRAVRRRTEHDADARRKLERALRLLESDPFHPSLKSHKLTGPLDGLWACRVDYDIRIVFEFIADSRGDERAVLLHTLGSHDEVY